jgi:hypothetical protein
MEKLMARPGISYSDVVASAEKVAGSGKNPTVDNVREALGGTGSKTTIAPLLKRWKAEAHAVITHAEAGLPAPLLLALKGLHQQLQSDANALLEQARLEYASAMAASAEREHQLQIIHAADVAQQMTLAEQLVSSREAMGALEVAYQTDRITLAVTQSNNEGLQQRLADRAAEVASLNSLLQQSRQQFEHYQTTTAERRMEEQNAATQHFAQLEQEHRLVLRELAAQQAINLQQQKIIGAATCDHARLQQDIDALQNDLSALGIHRDRLTALVEQATLERQGLANDLAAAQQQMQETHWSLAAGQKETSMLTASLSKAELRLEQLVAEKYVWLMERAEIDRASQLADALTAQETPLAP